MNVMTKAALAREIADRIDVMSQQRCADFLDILADEVVAFFERGGDAIALRGFGTFRISRRKAFLAKSPRTGKTTDVPASRSITFKPAAEVRSRLNSRR